METKYTPSYIALLAEHFVDACEQAGLKQGSQMPLTIRKELSEAQTCLTNPIPRQLFIHGWQSLPEEIGSDIEQKVCAAVLALRTFQN